jgi:hypothetical protein
MKRLETVFYGIPLTITYYQGFRDEFSPESGHYTVPSRWRIETIEHNGEDISEILDDVVWHELEKRGNE